MQAHGIVLPYPAQGAYVGPSGSEVIFAVNLDPADRWLLQEKLGVMGRPKADSGTRRNRLRNPLQTGVYVHRNYFFGAVLPFIRRSQVPVGTEIHSFGSASFLA